MPTHNVIVFKILGAPQPQGSVKAFMVGGKPRLTSTNPKVRPWRQDAGHMAAEAGGNAGWPMGNEQTKAVSIYATFVFLKPKSAKKRINHTVKPDVDKLARALLDAMTGILYADDSQVVQLAALKCYGLTQETQVTVTLMG